MSESTPRSADAKKKEDTGNEEYSRFAHVGIASGRFITKRNTLKADIRMPLYVNAYVASTMHLSAEGHRAYLLLICHYCQHGPILDDLKQYTRISRSDAEVTESILNDFFVKDESGEKWTHRSIDIELQKTKKRRDAARERIRTKRKGPPEKRKPPIEKPRINSGPPQVQTGYDPNLTRNELVVNSTPPVSKKILTGKFANTTEPREGDRDLHQQVRDIFLQVRGVFASDRDEERAIDGLIAKARTRTRDPTDFVLGMIGQFQKMRDENRSEDKGFYRNLPFLPSSLDNSKIWERVLTRAQEEHKENRKHEAHLRKFQGRKLPW